MIRPPRTLAEPMPDAWADDPAQEDDAFARGADAAADMFVLIVVTFGLGVLITFAPATAAVLITPPLTVYFCRRRQWGFWGCLIMGMPAGMVFVLGMIAAEAVQRVPA